MPMVAVIEPVVSAVMAPTDARNPMVGFPVATMMKAGTVIEVEVDFNVIVVFADTACDNVTRHATLAPDITAVGPQTSEVTSTGTTNDIVADREDPL